MLHDGDPETTQYNDYMPLLLQHDLYFQKYNAKYNRKNTYQWPEQKIKQKKIQLILFVKLGMFF